MRILSLLLLGAAVLGLGIPSHGAAQPRSHLEIGLLLIAIDAQADHLRISEGFRVTNPGPPRTQDLRIALPPRAAYLTVHEGLPSPRDTAEGFVSSVDLPSGVTEIAYSYALAVGHEAVLVRTFPLPARRIEIAVRGEGVRASVLGGSILAPTDVGGAPLQRWEVRDLAAGSPLVVSLSGLPSRRSRVPRAAALALAGVLASALLLSWRRVHKDHPSR